MKSIVDFSKTLITSFDKLNLFKLIFMSLIKSFVLSIYSFNPPSKLVVSEISFVPPKNIIELSPKNIMARIIMLATFLLIVVFFVRYFIIGSTSKDIRYPITNGI